MSFVIQQAYWWESLDRSLLDVICIKIMLSIVDGHSTLGSRCEGSIVYDWHAMVRAVSGMFAKYTQLLLLNARHGEGVYK